MQTTMETLQAEAKRQLQKACYLFIWKNRHLMPESRYYEMHDAMQQEQTWPLFSSLVRETLIEQSKVLSDSTPFWMMIDSIGFYSEAAARHWKLQTEERLKRYMA